MLSSYRALLFFFFNDTATTEIYTLSLHDALPICSFLCFLCSVPDFVARYRESVMQPASKLTIAGWGCLLQSNRSEEHTSELQSQSNLVCRLLLEKKKQHDSHHGARQ